MFYCEKCAQEHVWPYFYGMHQSYGPCEQCERMAVCVDGDIEEE